MLAFPYTHENHFKFGYDGEWFVNRTSEDQTLQHTYGTAKARLDLRSASLRAAELIANSTDEKLYVMMSGGIDSELVARSFLTIGADFTAAIMRFNDDRNCHDIGYAESYCKENNIPVQYFDLNPAKFWFSKESSRIAKIAQCYIPAIICTMWLVEQIPGFPIIGNGDPLVYKPIDDMAIPMDTFMLPQPARYKINPYVIRESEHILAWYKHMINLDIEGVPGFHQYTPEQVLAVLDHPLTHRYVQENHYQNNEHLKHRIYEEAFPGLERRYPCNGMEFLMDESVKAKKHKLLQACGFAVREDRIPYSDILVHLKKDLVGDERVELPTSSV
jgi:hypothetical protein